MMKKIAYLLFSFVLLMSFSVPALADETQKLEEPKTLEEISEYLDNLSTTQVYTASEDEVISQMIKEKKITRSELDSQLLSLSKLSVDELEQKGYNDDQIHLFQTYEKGEDAFDHMFRSSSSESAKLDFRYGLAGTGEQDKVMIAYDIKWSKCPVFTFTDTFGIGWIAADKDSNPLATRINSCICEAQYYTVDGKKTSKVSNVAKDKQASYAVLFYPNIGSANGDYAKYIGGMTEVGTQSGSKNMDTINIFVAYGHTVIKPTLDLTVKWESTKADAEVVFNVSKIQERMVKDDNVFRYFEQSIVVA